MLATLPKHSPTETCFRTRYPGQVGVVRLLTKYAPPDIVSQVLTERGVEIEATSASQQGDGRCSILSS